MQKKKLQKLLLWTGSSMAILIAVLGVHIYLVTQPKAPTATTRAMARIDFQDDISEAQAVEYSNWLSKQKGIDHVLCNASSNIAVFTFFPAAADANVITSTLASTFGIHASRHVPTTAEMSSGCPVAANTLSYRAMKLLTSL